MGGHDIPVKKVIGAHHEFHDEAFASAWATRFVPTPERLELFALMSSEVQSHIPTNGCIVELGLGPGYLAEHLLDLLPGVHYFGIDFSRPMLDLARHRLRAHAPRVAYLQADLVKDNWRRGVPTPVHAIVSTWTLHDLGSRKHVSTVYGTCARILQDGGLFLNGDFIKPELATHEYEPGRFEITTHVQLLQRVGFRDAQCLAVLENELESPTAAQNYACFKGLAQRPA